MSNVENHPFIRELAMLEVPFIPQSYQGCGYASLTMLLHFAQPRYRHITAESLQKRMMPSDPNEEVAIRPTFSHMASVAQQIVGETHDVRLLHSGYLNPDGTPDRERPNLYADLKKNSPEDKISLVKKLIQRGYPPMLRFPGHTVVVKGYGTSIRNNTFFYLNDPFLGEDNVISEENLVTAWQKEDGSQTIVPTSDTNPGVLMSSAFLMLFLAPKRKA